MKIKHSEEPSSGSHSGNIRYKVGQRHSLDGGEDGINIYPSNNTRVTLDRIADDISHSSSLTPGDVKATFSAINFEVGMALAAGHRVYLEGLGTFSPVLGTKTPIDDPSKLTSRDVCLKRVAFAPDARLMNYLADIRFHRERGDVLTSAATDDEQEQLLAGYFAEHDALDSKILARLLRCGLTTARRRLHVLVAQGRLVHIAHTRFWYRPAPGSFGR